MWRKKKKKENILLSPFVLRADLSFFLWREVILDIEGLADIFWRLALDHICDGLATNIEEGLDIKVVGSLGKLSTLPSRNIFDVARKPERKEYQNDFEQHLLVDLHEFLIPFIDICGFPAGVVVLVAGAWRVALMLCAPRNNLFQDGSVDLRVGC